MSTNGRPQLDERDEKVAIARRARLREKIETNLVEIAEDRWTLFVVVPPGVDVEIVRDGGT